MELDELFHKRRSIREFDEKSIPEDKIEKLLEAARLAPSATNRQPWRFLVIKDEDIINHLDEAVMQPFVTHAPVIIVCCFDRMAFTKLFIKKRVEELVAAGVMNREVADMLYQRKMPEKAEEAGIPVSAYIDMGIAVEHIVLRATSLGLGSCWVRMFNAGRVCEILKLPPEITPIVLLPVGYPAENPPFRPRLPMEEILLKTD